MSHNERSADILGELRSILGALLFPKPRRWTDSVTLCSVRVARS
jgi:hypothetical protein